MVEHNLKVLLVSTSVLPVGARRYAGIEKLVLSFAEELSKTHKVTVAAPKGSIVPKECQLIETVKVPDEQDRDVLAYQRYYQQLDQFDVIHDFSHSHVVGRMEADRPYLAMLWDPVVTKYPKSHFNIMCQTKWQAARFEQVYAQKCVVQEPQAIEPDRYKFWDEKSDRFLFIAKLTPDKGAHLALKYCKMLGVPLDIVGGLIPTDTKNYYHDLMSACDGKKYRLLYDLTEYEKIELLQRAKGVLYPVLQDEAHWLVGPEAWMCGTPTITFDRAAMKEIHPDIPLAFLPKNEEEFVQCLKTLRDGMNEARYILLRQYAEERFSAEKIVGKFVELYQKVMNGERW